MKKKWREKLLHGRYSLETYKGDVDRTTTNHKWLSSSSLKGGLILGFILAAQEQSLVTRMYRAKILKMGQTQDADYVHIVKKLSTT